MWKIVISLFGLVTVGSQDVIKSVILDDIIDADMEFYRNNIAEDESHTMPIKLDGEGLHLENVTVKPYNLWKREPLKNHDHGMLSLDTINKRYSFEYGISLNNFSADFDSLKLPSWQQVRNNVKAEFEKIIFRFGPMSRTFLPNSMCNSTLSVTLEEAKVTINGEDVSEAFSTVVARAFERKSKALCNIVNPHKCLKIFTPLMFGHF